MPPLRENVNIVVQSQPPCDHIGMTNVRRDRVPKYPAPGQWFRVTCRGCKKFLGYENHEASGTRKTARRKR